MRETWTGPSAHVLVRWAIKSDISKHGDTMVFSFQTIPEAIDCAMAAVAGQLRLESRPLPMSTPRVVIDMVLGETAIHSTTCQLLQMSALAHDGQILLTAAAAEQVVSSCRAGISAHPAGWHQLPGSGQTHPLHELIHPAMPTPSLPLRSFHSIPHNLPVQLSSFVGRAHAQLQIRQLLDHNRLLTLTGPGGCGKTRLALHLAPAAALEFEHGAWLIELAPLSAGRFIPDVIASVLGLREHPGRDVLSCLVEELRYKNLLLIMDNCEHLIESAAHVVNALLHSCPGIQILTTSREPLGVAGEVLWRVPPLHVPDQAVHATAKSLLEFEAPRLFVERATQAEPQFRVTEQTAPAIQRICQTLHGIPLAIELAATKVTAFTLGEIAEQLASGLRLLFGGQRTIPRHRSLRAAIDWSYQLLTKEERLLWHWLAVFPSAFSAEAADTLGTAGNLTNAVECLVSLINKSIVMVEERQETKRYYLLASVRQFGLEQLVASGDEAYVRNLHLQWCISYLRKHGPTSLAGSPPELITKVDLEYNNLRAALSWVQESNQQAQGLELCQLLSGYWYQTGRFSEGRMWVEQTIGQSANSIEPQMQAEVLHYLAALAERQGDHVYAQHTLNQAVDIFKEQGLTEGLTRSLSLLGVVLECLGDTEAASAMHAEAYAISQRTNNKMGIARCLINTGDLEAKLGHSGAAQRMFMDALPLLQELDHKLGIAIVLINLGCLACLDGSYGKAGELFTESMRLLDELGNRTLRSGLLCNMGLLARCRGDLPSALKLLQQALELCIDLDNKADLADTLEQLAAVVVALEASPEGPCLLGSAEAIRSTTRRAITEFERRCHDEIVALIRASFATDVFESARQLGRSMPLPEVVALARSTIQRLCDDRATPQRPRDRLRQAQGETVAAPFKEGLLTQRELEVVQLVGKGSSDQEVATQLCISPSTVRRHLENIFGKLGLSSRTKLMHWAFENNLLA